MGRKTNEVAVEALASQFEGRGLLTDGLCGGCKHSMIYRRKGQNDLFIHCHELHACVPPDITECSSFEEHKRMSIYDMQQMALVLDPREGINGNSYR